MESQADTALGLSLCVTYFFTMLCIGHSADTDEIPRVAASHQVLNVLLFKPILNFKKGNFDQKPILMNNWSFQREVNIQKPNKKTTTVFRLTRPYQIYWWNLECFSGFLENIIYHLERHGIIFFPEK